MIWIISNWAEETGVFTSYDSYREAYELGAMSLYCARQNDDFSFIKKEDIVIVRTRDNNIYQRLLESQRKIGFRSTIESENVILLTTDKDLAKGVLEKVGVSTPPTIQIDKVVDFKTYFVKTKCDSDSLGIDSESKCNGYVEVYSKVISMLCNGYDPLIEEYIDSEDYTTSVIYDSDTGELNSYSCIIHPDTELGYHTFKSKLSFSFTPIKYENEVLDEACKKVFKAIGAKHYLRIDSRMKDGVPYILDINLLPGLGPMSHMAKCMEMNGVSYFDFIRKVVNSAF